MRLHGHLLLLVLVVLIGSSETQGQSSALTSVFTTKTFPNHADSTVSPDLTEAPDTKWTHSGAVKDETSPQSAKGTAHWETATVPVSLGSQQMNTHPSEATSQQTSSLVGMSTQPHGAFSDSEDGLSSKPSFWTAAFSSQASVSANRRQDSPTVSPSTPSHTGKATSSEGHTFPTQLPSQSLGPDQPPASPPAKAETSDLEVPAELAVGDDDVKGRSRQSSSPLDALLAALLSVFIVTTAVVFLVLFLRFRQKTNQPEFHRLHDLPMDDLMEDTPLSRYSY